MDNKQTLTIELTRFLDSNPAAIAELLDGADLPGVIGLLAYHRMGGVAYHVLRKAALLQAIGREARTVLATLYQDNCRRRTAFLHGLTYLSSCFTGATFPYAFLKGAFLTTQLYPPGLRTSHDYDVLVKQSDLTACEALLRNAGFVQGKWDSEKEEIVPATRQEILSSRMNRGETVPFLRLLDGKPLEVDLNFSVDHQARQTDAVEKLLRHTVPFSVGEGTLFTLPPAEFFLHLCAHLYKEARIYNWVEMGRDLQLYKFLDIYTILFAYSSSSFAETAAQLAIDCGLREDCYFTLHGTLALYPALWHQPGIDVLYKLLRPASDDCLQLVHQPAKNRTYRYTEDFLTRFFAPDRRKLLIIDEKKGEKAYETQS